MTLVLNQSDISLIRSGEHAKCFVRSPAQTAPPADPWSAPDQADRAWLTDRDLQALRPTQLSLRRWTWTRPKRYLSTIGRTGDRPRLGYVPNAAYAQVAEFLANFRKLQEMLNEICAINAELLRRRESLD